MSHLGTSFHIRAREPGSPEDRKLREWAEASEILVTSLFRESGRRRGLFVDSRIGAVAPAGDAPIATANEADFRRFKNSGVEIAWVAIQTHRRPPSESWTDGQLPTLKGGESLAVGAKSHTEQATLCSRKSSVWVDSEVSPAWSRIKLPSTEFAETALQSAPFSWVQHGVVSLLGAQIQPIYLPALWYA